MKTAIGVLGFCLLVLIGQKTLAQNSDLSSIVPSSAPAFTILGASPTEISKPNTWSALQSTLVQNFSSNNQAVIPKDFALEISPYWLSNHPTFTYKSYLDGHNFSLRNLKLSVATSKVSYGKDSVQGMGFGFRIPIRTFTKKASEANTKLQDLINKTNEETVNYQSPFMFWIRSEYKGKTVGDFLDDIDKNLVSKPDPYWGTYGTQIKNAKADTLQVAFGNRRADLFADDKPAIVSCLQAYFSAHNHQKAADITQQISTSLKDAAEWEVSGALGMVFPTGQFNYSRLSQLGIWSDYSFDLSKTGNLGGTIALRYIRSFRIDSIGPANNLDLLGRFNLYTGNNQKFNLSVWGLIRLKSSATQTVIVDNVRYDHYSGTWDNKYGVDVTYKFADNIAVAYSFGKGYGADPFSLPKLQSKLLSFLSLYYSINIKASKSGPNYLLKGL